MENELINKVADEFIERFKVPKSKYKIRILKKVISEYLKDCPYEEFDQFSWSEIMEGYDELLNEK